MLSVVKMLLKGEVGGHVLNSHRNYIVDYGWDVSWKNHGIVFLNFCGNPVNLACKSTLIGFLIGSLFAIKTSHHLEVSDIILTAKRAG